MKCESYDILILAPFPARRHRRHFGRPERGHLAPRSFQTDRSLRRKTEPEVRPSELVQPPEEVGRAEEGLRPEVRAEDRSAGELRQEQKFRGRLRPGKSGEEPGRAGDEASEHLRTRVQRSPLDEALQPVPDRRCEGNRSNYQDLVSARILDLQAL